MLRTETKTASAVRARRFVSGAALALALSPAAVGAGEPSSDVSLTTIQNVHDTKIANGALYVAVGCDGNGPRDGRIQVLDVKGGTLLWQAALGLGDSCLWHVATRPGRVFSMGFVEDEGDDRGNNLIVQCHRLSDGALLWRKTFEAPNPKKDVVHPVSFRNQLEVVQGTVLAALSTPARTRVLRLDAKDGTLLP